ncbi:MAG: hypothetical protein AN481_14575 [Aphanizomenon flos-aquae LD13]|jgi:hypothetical protein|uniref:Uncharacterized protein n=1 Tax=Aphanizomenon flos-aquae LD13 TaxID=1710894 RepID=A0A1B7VSG5_APHFL|nr:hypothetical protein [Aphanizomenon flos-aquae UKL13-PB]OBQ23856.1 MAG: hypothetical protein AN481_14575 [Aphanizomenon flos-aquae LD13]
MISTITNNHLHDRLIISHNSRRHIDPPGLWIMVSIGSLSLHLLVFWLVGSSNNFKPWFPPSNQSSVPIDLIEIPSQPKSKIKPQPTTTKIKTQSYFSPSPKSLPVKLENQDDDQITSDTNLPQQDKVQKPQVQKPQVQKPQVQKPQVQKPQVQKPQVQKPQVQKPQVQKPQVQKPQVQKSPVRQQFYPTKPIAEVTPIIPESELPWNSRQEIKLGEEKPLPQDIPTDFPTPTAKPSTNPNLEPSPTVTGEGAIATINPINREQVSELIQQRTLSPDGLPDVLAEYKGSPEKELEISVLPTDKNLKPANILASLIIDDNGKFQQAKIINIEPIVLPSQKNIYEQALNQIFAEESFLAAYNQDGSKPQLSNLYILLQIKTINSP